MVVTGLGVTSPAGVDLDAFWSRVASGRSCAARIRRFDPVDLPVPIGCEVTDLEMDRYLSPKELRRVDRISQFGIAAAVDALDDAGDPGADPQRCAVVAGVGIGGLITLEDQIGVLHRSGPTRVSPFLVPMMMPNATPALVSLRLGWTGPTWRSPPRAPRAPTRSVRRRS